MNVPAWATITPGRLTVKAYNGIGGQQSKAADAAAAHSTAYAYNQAGRLISATVSGASSQFAYNGDGARLRQFVSGTVTSYTLVAGQFGPDIPIPIPELLGLVGAGGGVMAFSSTFPGTMMPDLHVYGGSAYLEASAGSGVWDLPITYAVVALDYTPKAGSYKVYSSRLDMARDILDGNDSPLGLVPPAAREWAAIQAATYSPPTP